MKRVALFALAVIVPGGFVVAAGYAAYRWHRKRAARREVEVEMKRHGDVAWAFKRGEA